MNDHGSISIEHRKETFAGMMAALLIAGLVASFVGAWVNIGNDAQFARAKDLVQFASSIVAIVIGYYFGAAQAKTDIAAARSKADAAQARLENADAVIDSLAEKYEMRGGAAPGSPPQADDEAYNLVRTYIDKRSKAALHSNGSRH